MTKCYVCETTITKENWTWEHILLNSIGGHLKSRDLICRNCNSLFGHKVDDALASELNPFSNQLNIKREKKGVIPPITAKTKDGEPISINPGGKPIEVKPKIKVKEHGPQVSIELKARNLKDANKALLGLKRKYSKIDIESALKQVTFQSEYMTEMVSFRIQFGGDKALRSITKTAVNFFIFSGGERTFIKHLIPYIKNDEPEDCVWFYYENDEEFINKGNNQVIHGLVLEGDPEKRILWCYVELFNACRFMVLLNKNYNGKRIYKQYVYDLIQEREVSLKCNIQINKSNLFDLKEKKLDPKTLEYQLNKLQGIIMKKQFADHQKELIAEAFRNSLGKYPEGTIITSDMIKDQVQEIMNRISPFLSHHFSKTKL